MDALSAFFTDPLRLTLLAAAIVVLLGIIVFGRKAGNTVNKDELSNDEISDALIRNDDENVIIKDDQALIVKEEAELPAVVQEKKPPAVIQQPDDPVQPEQFISEEEPVIDSQAEEIIDVANAEEKDHFIVLHVEAPEDKAFSGQALLEAMEQCHLVYGDFKIFHYPHPQDEKLSLFSVVNMLKPGFFEKEQMSELATTGISFFMRIPVMPGHHQDVFTTMLATAQNLSRMLGGTLMNEQHLPLTQALVDDIKQQIKTLEQDTHTGTQTS